MRVERECERSSGEYTLQVGRVDDGLQAAPALVGELIVALGPTFQSMQRSRRAACDVPPEAQVLDLLANANEV